MDKKQISSMQNEITDILFTHLDGVLCSTCRYNDPSYEGNFPGDSSEKACEECHRKSIGWGISRKKAKRISELIIEEIGFAEKGIE
jgi:hypothetical protein